MQFHLIILIFAIINSSVLARRPSKIVKGQSASIIDAPYVVRIGVDIAINDPIGHLCTGTIIGPRHILTVAHCFNEIEEDWEFKSLRVVAGEDEYQRKTKAYQIEEIYIHPFYKLAQRKLVDADIAIVKLTETIPMLDHQRPAKMATHYLPLWSEGIIYGWGKLGTDENNSPNLLKLDVAICNRAACGMISAGLWAYDELCIQPRLHTGPCTGDSGGPVMVNGTLHGIITWTYDCASPKPSGIISVERHSDWIRSVIDGKGGLLLYSAQSGGYYSYHIVTTPRPSTTTHRPELAGHPFELLKKRKKN